MKCDVSLPLGGDLTSRFSFKEVQVKVTRKGLSVDLIMLEIMDSSMVLGMGQLSRYNIPYLCRRKRIMFHPSIGEVFKYKGTPRGSEWLVVSVLKASRVLLKGCVRYLASIVDTTREVVTELADVRIFCKNCLTRSLFVLAIRSREL